MYSSSGKIKDMIDEVNAPITLMKSVKLGMIILTAVTDKTMKERVISLLKATF